MTTDDDLFCDDELEESSEVEPEAAPWRILIVDDDPGIHDITRFALGRTRFRDRGLHFLHAYSAAQGLEMIRREPDVALIFLDVVMETNDAGLRFVHTLRQELERLAVRVILRTGQPGQAPERDVILDYDINDYKEKTELTAERLFVSTVAALRGYDDIKAIERYKDAAYDTLTEESNLGRQILDLLPLPLIQTDSLLSVTVCNQAAAILLGGPADAFVGQPLEFLMPEATATLYGAGLVPATGPQTATITVPVNGRIVHLHVSPLALSSGGAGGYLLRLATEAPE